MEVDLNGGNGGNVYNDEIAGCPTWVPTIGLYQPGTSCSNNPGDVNYLQGCLNVKTGVKNGPTQQGVADLIALDRSATWNTLTNSVTGGCTTAGNCRTTNPLGIDISPRIVPIALFDPQAYSDGGFNGNGGMARVVNMLGLFRRRHVQRRLPDTPRMVRHRRRSGQDGRRPTDEVSRAVEKFIRVRRSRNVPSFTRLIR